MFWGIGHTLGYLSGIALGLETSLSNLGLPAPGYTGTLVIKFKCHIALIYIRT